MHDISAQMRVEYSDDPQQEAFRQLLLPRNLRLRRNTYVTPPPQTPADYRALARAAQRRKSRAMKRMEARAVWL